MLLTLIHNHPYDDDGAFFLFKQQVDDSECFFGHREPQVTLIIVLSLILTILLFTYMVYARICIKAITSQRPRSAAAAGLAVAAAAPTSIMACGGGSGNHLVHKKRYIF